MGSFSLFQLANGDWISDIISTPLLAIAAPVRALLSTVQAQAAAVGSQFQNFFQAAGQNISSQIDFGISDFDRYFGDIDGNSEADACRSDYTQRYYAIGNETSK